MHFQVSHLFKSFAGQEIISDVSFTVSGREKVGLLGKNGSGKSTILRILAGMETPDSGIVSFSPQDVRIGFLPQIADPDLKLSSGQKTKKQLQQIISSKPDILLLDEPTNHLDLGGLAWLEKIVTSFPGPVLLISHDRYFLDQVVDRILEIEDGKLKSFSGNYSLYKENKKLQTEANARLYQEQQKRLNKLEDRSRTIKNRTQQLEVSTTGTDHYVRRKAAKAARSAISMEKRIQKEIDQSSVQKPEQNWELKALFKPKHECGQTILQIKSLNYKDILTDFSLIIQKGQRIALTGPNGSGKTTLIKLILGQIIPDGGEVSLGNGVVVGYLSQEHQELASDRIVLDELISDNIDRTESYKLLRRFLLPPEKINQPVKLLSSGEKAKLLLAKIMTSGANFIILDEPTNHLDIPSREAIEESLSNYPGTLLVVSHDRYFLQRIGIESEIIL